MIGQAIGNDQIAIVEQRAAGVHHVWDIAFALGFIRGEKRFAQATEDARGLLQVEQERPEAILPHGADAVTQHQPAGFRFNRRTAVANLEKFPRLRGFEQHSRGLPEMNILRQHQQDVLVILA